MRQIISIFYLLLLVLAACSTPMNIVETRPVLEDDTVSLDGYVYSLPRTSFRVDIELIRTRTLRGPYYRFAEKLLSIEDVPTRNSNSWYISDISVQPFSEADPDHFYLVRQVEGETDLSKLLKLGDEGLIFDFSEHLAGRSERVSGEPERSGPVFTDLSMEKTTMMAIDTFYKTILTDTAFLRVPVLKRQSMVKTIDEKAEEAADFILELRYERFMMLTGNNSEVPETAVARLDELEKQYLELFTGKSFEQSYRYTFFITPSGEEVFENIEILELSGSRGVVDESTGDSEVLSMKFSRLGKTEILYDPKRPDPLPVRKNAIYYRVPDMADVEISLGGRKLLNGRYTVSQYGEILSLPLN